MLNLKSNLSGMPLQNNMKRKISLNVFTQCNNQSYNMVIKEVKCLCLNKYLQRFDPHPLKFQALRRGYPLNLHRHSIASENDVKTN